MWKLHERAGQAQVCEISVQRHAFHPAKEIGEIRRRRADFASHLDEPNPVRQAPLQTLLRASNQAVGRRRVRATRPTVVVECRSEERKNPLGGVERVYL